MGLVRCERGRWRGRASLVKQLTSLLAAANHEMRSLRRAGSSSSRCWCTTPVRSTLTCERFAPARCFDKDDTSSFEQPK